MKRSFLMLSLLCALFSGAAAQTLPTYFDSTSFWGHYKWFGTQNFPGSCVHTINTYWTIDGDSTALGHTWYKLYSTGSSQIDCIYPTTHYISRYAHQYAGLLRQAGKQMRMVFPNTVTDTVLYDFDLQIGDSFFPDTFYYPESNTVLSITPFASDTTRLVFAGEPPMHSGLATTWIEGIGAKWGTVFGPQVIGCFSSDCILTTNLTCYRMQGHDFGFSECSSAWQNYQAIVQAVTATKPGPADAPEVWLSPNPGHDHLDVHAFGMEVREIRLVHASGQVVRSQSDFTMEGDGVFSSAVGQLPAGLYQVLVYGENTAVALKWVKI